MLRLPHSRMPVLHLPHRHLVLSQIRLNFTLACLIPVLGTPGPAGLVPRPVPPLLLLFLHLIRRGVEEVPPIVEVQGIELPGLPHFVLPSVLGLGDHLAVYWHLIRHNRLTLVGESMEVDLKKALVYAKGTWNSIIGLLLVYHKFEVMRIQVIVRPGYSSLAALDAVHIVVWRDRKVLKQKKNEKHKGVLKSIVLQKNFYTYIPLTLYPRRGSKGISDIPPRRPRFTKII
jgi:hypothetical protein